MTTHLTPSPHEAIAKVREALESAKTKINAGMKRHPWDCDCLVCYDLASADRAIGAALDGVASLKSALATDAALRAAQVEALERAAEVAKQTTSRIMTGDWKFNEANACEVIAARILALAERVKNGESLT